MTLYLAGEELANTIESILPGAVEAHNADSVWIKQESLFEAAKNLRSNPKTSFDLLVSLTAVDNIDHFEVVYHLRSLLHNTFGVVKVKTGIARNTPSVPSVVSLWRGADLQEREVWDLMGIKFEGRSDMKRIMLWEGFPGHPLRKDFITYDQSLVEKGDPS